MIQATRLTIDLSETEEENRGVIIKKVNDQERLFASFKVVHYILGYCMDDFRNNKITLQITYKQTNLN